METAVTVANITSKRVSIYCWSLPFSTWLRENHNTIVNLENEVLLRGSSNRIWKEGCKVSQAPNRFFELVWRCYHWEKSSRHPPVFWISLVRVWNQKLWVLWCPRTIQLFEALVNIKAISKYATRGFLDLEVLEISRFLGRTQRVPKRTIYWGTVASDDDIKHFRG